MVNAETVKKTGHEITDWLSSLLVRSVITGLLNPLAKVCWKKQNFDENITIYYSN